MVLTEKDDHEYIPLPRSYCFVDGLLVQVKYGYQFQQLPDETYVYITNYEHFSAHFILILPPGMSSSRRQAIKEWMAVPENVVDKETRLLKLLFPPE